MTMKTWIILCSLAAYVMRWVAHFDGSSNIEELRWYIVSIIFLAAWMVVHALEKKDG